jgi:glycosyltransferase involved in cell wall biosynthesis
MYYNYINDVESLKLWNKCKPYRFEILKGCKMIYPNSKAEEDIIKKEFGNSIPCTVTYNGVDIENKDIPLYNFKERYQLNDYVLCVGRICHRKNQLALAKACKDLGLQLVLIGNINDKEYFNQCLGYGNVKHLGFMDSYNIYNAYKFCKIHVLPSFIETPGLSSLEAAAVGCNIVSTSEGSTFEYFDNMAEYCNPYDDNSIIEAIRRAYRKNPSNMLKKHILENFSWEKCIKELYDSYKQIIE